MWKRTDSELPRNDAVVIVIGDHGLPLCYAKSFDGGKDWIECEADGSIVHGRDGSPSFISKPRWFCYPP